MVTTLSITINKSRHLALRKVVVKLSVSMPNAVMLSVVVPRHEPTRVEQVSSIHTKRAWVIENSSMTSLHSGFTRLSQYL